MGEEMVVECRGLTKTYGRRRAVDGLELTVRRGELFGFLGPNGAGKSTTIRLLLDLVRPDSGQALLFGRSVRSSRRSVLPLVGAMVERPDLYEHMTGRQNLEVLSRLSGACSAKRIDEVLELVGLADRQRDRVHAYSHGMRQRLGLAQAMLPHPQLLVLDEPANGLDPAGLIDVRNLLRHLAHDQGMTVLLSSHILSEVEIICSHVALVSRGRCVMQGAVADLLSGGECVADLAVDDTARALQVLESLPGVAGIEGGLGSVVVRASDGRLAEVNRVLVEAGVAVSALVPRKATLEERYMTVMDEAQHADAAAR